MANAIQEQIRNEAGDALDPNDERTLELVKIFSNAKAQRCVKS